MVYCPNPKCKQRQNPATAEICQSCETPLTLNQNYRLIRPLVNLERSGNTEVFEIEDLRCANQPEPKPKVMKLLKYNGGDLERLFKQEANYLQGLDHPAIPKIDRLDFAENGFFSFVAPLTNRKVHYFVMEKVEGDNLRDWMQQHSPMDNSTLLKWLRELLTILDYLHTQNIWHRDIKPSNIMLQPDGQLVLIDFGAVKQIRPHREEAGDIPPRPDITVTDTCVFAAGYTPPEQMDGRTVQQSDFFALGRSCVHLLTQIPPYNLRVDDGGQLVWREKVPDISVVLADWIDQLMSPLVRDRPQSAAEVLSHIQSENILPPPQTQDSSEGEVSSGSSPWGSLLNLILFSILLISGLLWWQAHENSQPIQDTNQQVQHPLPSLRLGRGIE
ncbi:serine/threonine protein kinase [Acaryochloris sp. 'Moss Beach']|uniref:serine/threonine protein kinase n=1 Tax=Acaryochloris sp. 'Moss Beach' TaxID=2740837 RepID=UPI001F364726|nr:serine/threonine-protein kinase [Acaryochloris sp. 'Moss Beach']UJB69246.1 serine/threonine protein kinase [Acaryochloris sp. 'Moss Beach']